MIKLDTQNRTLLLRIESARAQKNEASAKIAQLQGDEKQAMIMKILQKEMLFLFPLLTLFILLKLPSALGLYWSISSLWATLEQLWFKKHDHKRTAEHS